MPVSDLGYYYIFQNAQGDQQGDSVSDTWVIGKNIIAHQLRFFCFKSTGDK